MSVKSGQAITVLFVTQNPTTGAATDADALPTGTLYVNGTADAAVVTETNITTGLYKAALTLPALSAGDVVALRIAATVAAVAGEGVVWQEVADTERVSDLNDLSAADVNAEVDTALSDIRLDHLVAVADADDPVDNSIVAKLAASDGDWSGYALATDSLEALRDRGDAEWATAVGFSVAGDLMNLANDAITSAKFDESTAFPLTATDAGATYVARTGADSDTLETLSDEIAAVPTATQVVDEWETQSQADPTGFHVNVLEVNGTAQTANDNGADINEILIDTAVLGAAMPDSIPADGTIPTPIQALYMTIQYLNERSVSGTTVTVKKADGSTSLYTLTLSDATDPTSITRAT